MHVVGACARPRVRARWCVCARVHAGGRAGAGRARQVKIEAFLEKLRAIVAVDVDVGIDACRHRRRRRQQCRRRDRYLCVRLFNFV